MGDGGHNALGSDKEVVAKFSLFRIREQREIIGSVVLSTRDMVRAPWCGSFS